VTVVVGPNACGKSTLLRGLARLLRPRSGAVLLDGRPIHEQPTRTVARTLGLLPQHPVAPEGVTVAELVGRGRHPHQGLWRRSSAHDAEAVERALAETGTSSLADAPVAELSGGQRQRVWIAMALAQETDLLLLDEPTTYLDLTHQIEMLDLVAALNAERAPRSSWCCTTSAWRRGMPTTSSPCGPASSRRRAHPPTCSPRRWCARCSPSTRA